MPDYLSIDSNDNPESKAFVTRAVYLSVPLIDGSDDVIFYTVNAFNLQQKLPNALLMIYPDSGHGRQYRHPDMFLQHIRMFLDQPE